MSLRPSSKDPLSRNQIVAAIGAHGEGTPLTSHNKANQAPTAACGRGRQIYPPSRLSFLRLEPVSMPHPDT